MPRSISAAVLTTVALALTACGGTPTPVASGPATLAFVSPPTQLKTGTSGKLTVVIKDAQGTTLNDAVTLTSSNPDLVSVGADGTWTALRLTPDQIPVTLTAKVGTLMTPLSVTTYGLELTGGTINFAPGTAQAAIGTTFLARFRSAAGAASFPSTRVNLSGPAGFDAGKFELPINAPSTAGNANGSVYGDETQKPIAGSYTGSLTVNGETYTATTTVDPSSVLAPPTRPGVTLTRTTLGISGTVPSGSTLAGVVYDNTSYVAFGPDHDAGSLPATDPLKTPLAAGTYYTGVYGFSSPVRTFTAPTPTKFNQSFTVVGTVTLP